MQLEVQVSDQQDSLDSLNCNQEVYNTKIPTMVTDFLDNQKQVQSGVADLPMICHSNFVPGEQDATLIPSIEDSTSSFSFGQSQHKSNSSSSSALNKVTLAEL